MSKFVNLRISVLLGLLLCSVAQAEVIDGEDLRDPTRPVDAMFPPGSGGSDVLSGLVSGAAGLLSRAYTVSFIRAGGSEPVAMVNEQLVKTGDMIGSAEVVAIDAHSVSLRVNGEIQRVSSFAETVKSRVEAPQ